MTSDHRYCQLNSTLLPQLGVAIFTPDKSFHFRRPSVIMLQMYISILLGVQCQGAPFSCQWDLQKCQFGPAKTATPERPCFKATGTRR